MLDRICNGIGCIQDNLNIFVSTKGTIGVVGMYEAMAWETLLQKRYQTTLICQDPPQISS